MPKSDRRRYFEHEEEKEECCERYSKDEHIHTAFRIADGCWRHYEGEGGGGTSSMGSLYSGGLGPCAYVRLRLAILMGHDDVVIEGMAEDDRETKKARLLQDGLAAVEDALLLLCKGKEERKKTKCTLLGGPVSGALAMKVALLQQLGRTKEAVTTAQEVLFLLSSEEKDLADCECEVLNGRAGHLQLISFLREHLGEEHFGKEYVRDTIRAIIHNGINTSRREKTKCTSAETAAALPPLLWEWHDKVYLGACHGVVGILYSLLHFVREIRSLHHELGNDVTSLIQTTINILYDKMCFPSGNLLSSLGKKKDDKINDKLVQWCHGATGYILLLLKASQVYSNSDLCYLEMAQKIAKEVVYPRGLLKKGVGLCHGISGNAYAFLAIYCHLLEKEKEQIQQQNTVSATGTKLTFLPSSSSSTPLQPSPKKQKCKKDRHKWEEKQWLQMAHQFANFAIQHLDHLEHEPGRPFSLYEGNAGLIILLVDLVDSNFLTFPCFPF